MARDMTARKYRIREARVRRAEDRPLYSGQAMQTSQDAVEVTKSEMTQYDREVIVVVNLNGGLKPIHFNIVSTGYLTQAIARIPNRLVSGILSNASSFLVLHRSMRKSGDVEFDRSFYGAETGKEQVGEMKEEYKAEKTGEVEDLSIKFGKGLAEPFAAKDEKEYMRIMIPNRDSADMTPWASFVLKASQVYENKFGKGLWAKLPTDGHITVSKSVAAGVENGKTVRNNEKRSVSVPELKSLIEFYKTKDRVSVVDQLEDMKKTAGEKVPAVKPRKKPTEIAK